MHVKSIQIQNTFENASYLIYYVKCILTVCMKYKIQNTAKYNVFKNVVSKFLQ